MARPLLPCVVMRITRTITLAVLCGTTVALLAGCAGDYAYGGTVYSEGYADPYYDDYYGYGYYGRPTMVRVYPDVYAVENRPNPLFFSGGFYWRWDDDGWYRSRYLDGRYVRVRPSVVPYSVRRIDRPRRYIEYRAPSRDRVYVVPRAHIRTRGDVYRDYRDGRRYYQRRYDRYDRYDRRYDRYDRRYDRYDRRWDRRDYRRWERR